MTDREKIVEEIQVYFDLYDGKKWETSTDYETIHSFLAVLNLNFGWQKIISADSYDTSFEDYYFITYFSKKIGKKIIFNQNAKSCWDTAEQFADWIVKTEQEVLEFENSLQERKQ